MRIRLLLPLLLIAPLLAGCGGTSAPTLAPGVIAEVGNQTVTLSDFNQALAEERADLKSEGTAVPAAGTSDYAEMQSDVVDTLFQQALFAIEANKLGISVSAAEVNTELKALKKADFGGSQAKYAAGIAKAGYTNAEIVSSIREKLLQNKLFAAIVKNVKPTAAQVAAYYEEHLTSYETPPSRKVQYILVGKNKETLAEQIVAQLKDGSATFAALAKKYSQDKSTSDKGGIYTVVEGQVVAQFQNAVFAKSSKTGELLAPVNTSQYGWFVIHILGPVVAAKVEPESKAAPGIISTLTADQQNSALSSWYTGVEKGFCKAGSVTFAAAYAPSPTPCSTLTATNQTTT